MKNPLKLLLLITCVSIVFYACKKDRTVVYVNQGTNNNGTNKPTSFHLNTASFLSSYAPKAETFTLDATKTMTIVSVSGNTYTLPSNCLLHQDNSAVTGNVEFKLIEYRTKSDMLTSGVTTLSGSELLNSGSMFYLMAYQNQEELKVKDNTTINVELLPNTTDMTPMDYYKGVTSNDSNNRINWIVDTVRIQATPRADSSSLKSKYRTPLFNYKMGYGNLDCVYNKSNNRHNTWKLKCPKNCNDTNSTAMIIMTQYNACGYAQWNQDGLTLNSSYYKLPVGENYKVILCRQWGEGEDDLEYAIIDFVVQTDNDLSYDGAMTKTTKAGLKAVIDGL